MAEPLRMLPEAELFRELDKLFNALAPDISRALQGALRSIGDETDLAVLEAAIRRKDWAEALDSVPWQNLEPGVLHLYKEDGPVGAALKHGHELGLKLLPGAGSGSTPPPISFAPYDYTKLSGTAQSYLEENGAALVKQITEESRSGMRKLLVEAYGPESKSKVATARELRDILNQKQVNGLIGVTERDAERLAKKMREWAEDPSLSVKQIQGRANRLHAKMIRQRANLIADTELQDAGNEGQVQLWKQRTEAGEIRVLGLEAFFVSETGERARRPIIHPRCQCSQRLRRVGPGVYIREWVTRIRGVCPRCQAFDGKRALAA